MCGCNQHANFNFQCRFANCRSCCFPLRSHKIWALAGAVSTTLKSKSSTVSGCTRLHSAYRSSAPTFGSHMVLMCCMLPASLGPSPLMIFDVNLSTKFGRSPWGSIHAFSQWDDKMPFLRIKLHSLQLKKGIEGKEQKLLEASLDFTLLVRLLTLVGAPCRECRYSIWRLLPHSHLKRCLR